MIKLKRMSENKCSVLIDIKLDECDLDLLDTVGLINEKEIKTTECDTKTAVPEMDNETILLTILNHQISKRLSSKTTNSSRELFFRFIYENIPDCLTYNFKDTLPDAMVIQKDYIIAHENDQGVKHLKQLFPKLYAKIFDAKNSNSYYLGSITTKDGEKAVILLKMEKSLLLNTFNVMHEWSHHLYALSRKAEGHEEPRELYKHYRCHFGKSSREEKRCDWYAIKAMHEIYGPGIVQTTLDKLNKRADSRMNEHPFTDNKYRVELLYRLARRYLKGC